MISPSLGSIKVMLRSYIINRISCQVWVFGIMNHNTSKFKITATQNPEFLEPKASKCRREFAQNSVQMGWADSHEP